MKRLLILTSKISPKKELFKSLVADRLGENVEVKLGVFSDISITIDGSSINAFVGDTNVRDFDLIYFRRIDHSIFPLSGTLAIVLDKLGIKYFDTKFREIGAAGDKLTALTKLAINGVPIPNTIFVTHENVNKNMDRIVSFLGLPIIAKDTEIQGNKGIFIIKKKADFDMLLKNSSAQFLFQEFIDIEKEFRLLVLKDNVAVTHTKVKRSYNDFVISYADPEETPEFIGPKGVSDNLKEQAIRASKILNIEIAGVDGVIVKGNAKPMIFEVNRGPGIEYDTEKSPEIDRISAFFKEELK